jgi:DMSO/TMAO reductase YedYZ molybdopterin-dependent catalytic subunit
MVAVSAGTLLAQLVDKDKLVKEYPVSAAAKNVRVNGGLGLEEEPEKAWKLQVQRAAGNPFHITLNELKKLPKKEVVFDLKCIEG